MKTFASNALAKAYCFTNPYGVPYFAIEFKVPKDSEPSYRGFPNSKKNRKMVAKFLREIAIKLERV